MIWIVVLCFRIPLVFSKNIKKAEATISVKEAAAVLLVFIC
ncbi:hypothetical protein HSIEG1_265 [Enterococcus sp. HSIEG1]|nr:hypothetical protein HSIEG1_265 [Enterococcus sp. HSIEG1]